MTDPAAIALPPSERPSLDEPRAPTNGDLEHVHERSSSISSNASAPHLSDAHRIALLEHQLDKVTQEKETLGTQYRGLLAKLTSMRNTLGDKLKQDADELDRREQQINTLQSSNDDLVETIETLKAELVAANEDIERGHSELEFMRTAASDSQRATADGENALQELTEGLEQMRFEREEWEAEAMRERVQRESLSATMSVLDREVSSLKSELATVSAERDKEAESAANLHSVLEEFQAAKENELRSVLGDLQAQLHDTTKQMQDYRHRAQTAEATISQSLLESGKTENLQKELKEKNLLIGKLQHQGVILNEHLTRALHRLKKDNTDNNVDRRLVTNVLISFLNTPRADSKRFEMLQLLSSILQWSDEEREQAGLQRATAKDSSASKARPRGHTRNSAKTKEANDAESEEGFTKLWVEFLLRESSSGTDAASSASPIMSPLSPRNLYSPQELPSASGRPSPFSHLASSSRTPSGSGTNTPAPSISTTLTRASSGAELSLNLEPSNENGMGANS